MELSEDKVEDFEVLIEWMITGTVSEKTIHRRTFDSGKSWSEDWDDTMDLIQYGDKYGIGHAGGPIALYIIGQHWKSQSQANIEIKPSHIALVFRVFEQRHLLHKEFAKEVLSQCIDGTSSHTDTGLCGDFKEEEKNVPGYAAEILSLLRGALLEVKLRDPLTKTVKFIRYLDNENE